MCHSLEECRRTYDELELVVIGLRFLLENGPALDAKAKAQFEVALGHARSELQRLSQRIYDETMGPDPPPRQ